MPPLVRNVAEVPTVDHDPERVDDEQYVQRIYDDVHDAIQAGMDRLATQRRFPVFG